MPTEVQYIVSAAAISAVLLFLGLAAGFYAGQQVASGRQSGLAPAPQPVVRQTLSIEFDHCLAGSREVARQTAALLEAANSPSTPHPAAMITAIELLAETTRRLVQELNHMKESTVRSGVGRSVLLPSATQHRDRDWRPLPSSMDPSLTPEELRAFTGRTEQSTASELARSQRHPYNCFQLLAPWNEGEPIPSPSKMIRVCCHDISVEGISFFLPEEPVFDFAVISLGHDESSPTLMSIEVRHSKVVFMHGELRHLIGCRFLHRVHAGSHDRHAFTGPCLSV